MEGKKFGEIEERLNFISDAVHAVSHGCFLTISLHYAQKNPRVAYKTQPQRLEDPKRSIPFDSLIERNHARIWELIEDRRASFKKHARSTKQKDRERSTSLEEIGRLQISKQSVAIGCCIRPCCIPGRSEPRAKLQIDISICLGVRRR